MSDHKHRFAMVPPGYVWLCTQGVHNRAGYDGSQAVVRCHHENCAQGWCVDHIQSARPPRPLRKKERRR